MPLPIRPRAALPLAILTGLLATGASPPPPPAAPAPPRREGEALTALTATSDGRLRLDALSAEGFSLRGGGLALSAALVGARPAPAERQGERVVFGAAAPGGGAVSYRFDGSALEDFIELPARPASPEVRYEVSLGGAAGLRLVSNTLELLDAQGAPRLRVAPPYLIDADGRRHPASLGVEGCAVDTDPRAPWGRPPAAPGSERCMLRVRWSDEAVRYPALLDPSWEATDLLITARAGAALVPLLDGRTLVIGGVTGDQNAFLPSKAVEIFDPASKTFAAAADLATARHGHTATLLPGGRVLVAGGQESFSDAAPPPSLASAEIYDGAAWSAAESFGFARSFHTATALPSGQVLVLGGFADNQPLASAEVFNPFAGDKGKWNGAAPMPVGRFAHSATPLLDGRILVVAGLTSSTGGALKDALFFDPNAPSGNPWSSAGGLPENRGAHSAVLTAGGQVVVVGGCKGATGSPPFFLGGCTLPSKTQVFSPSLKAWAPFDPPPLLPIDATTSAPGFGFAVVGLRNGWVLAAGGRAPDGKPGHSKQAALLRPFDAELNPPGNASIPVQGSNWTWLAPADETSNLSNFRSHASAAVDALGGVLVFGGLVRNGTTYKVQSQPADYLPYTPDGKECAPGSPLDCASGRCIQVTVAGNPKHICCDKPCDGPCVSCVGDVTGLLDGICAPIASKEGKACKAEPSCAGNQSDEGRCEAGVCAEFKRDCGYFACTDKVGCKTTCSTPSAGCSGDAVCVDKEGSKVCLPQRSDGEPCKAGLECVSGHCDRKPGDDAARICCDIDCSDVCSPPKDGIVRRSCSQNGSCGEGFDFCGGYLCDGDSKPVKCRTSCNTTFPCSSGFYCDEGACKQKIEQGKPCGNDAQCVAGDDGKGHCVEGVCCNASCQGSCSSCLSANTGGAEGLCLSVLKDHDPKSACAKDGSTCGPQGSCDGAGSCLFQAQGFSCSEPTGCSGDAELRRRCDGKGACGQPESVPCGAYGCGDKGCHTSCASNDDCADGNGCVNAGPSGACVAFSQTSCSGDGRLSHVACAGGACSDPVLEACPGSVRCASGACPTECATKEDCLDSFNCNRVTKKCVQTATCTGPTAFLDASGSPQTCRANQRCLDDDPAACQQPCRTSLDCVTGLVCRSSGQCGEPAKISGDDIDCYCAQPGRAGAAPASGAALALLGLGLAALRRTRRRACS